MVDHFIATKRKIADRYMLGELSPAEREKFEEHYFSCRECAEDVRDLLAISSNSKTVLFEMRDYGERRAATSSDGRSWLQALRSWRPQAVYAMAPALALCVLSVVTTLQSISLRSQLVPQAVAEFTLHPDARGEETEIGAQLLGSFIVLSADVQNVQGRLQWQIRGVASQIPLMEGVASSPPPGSSLSVLIPASKLRTRSVRSGNPAGWNAGGNQRRDGLSI